MSIVFVNFFRRHTPDETKAHSNAEVFKPGVPDRRIERERNFDVPGSLHLPKILRDGDFVKCELIYLQDLSVCNANYSAFFG